MAMLLSIAGASAQSISVKEQKPYGWVNATSVNFGSLNINTPTTNNLRVFVEGEVGELSATSDAEAFTATVTPVDEYSTLVLVANSATEGEVVGHVTVSGEGAEPVILEVKATFVDLNFTTIADMRAGMTAYNTEYYYTGRATVVNVENNNVFVQDETGGMEISTAEANPDLMAGDVVTFHGTANSPSYTFKSVIKGTVERADYFNWQLPVPNEQQTLSEADYGKLVLMKNMKYVKQVTSSDPFTGAESVTTTFENASGEQVMVKSCFVQRKALMFQNRSLLSQNLCIFAAKKKQR